MTQIEAARKDIITRQMTEVAEDEGLSPEEIRALVATGEVVIPHNLHHDFRAIGIGKRLRTKVNANIGASNFHQLDRRRSREALHRGPLRRRLGDGSFDRHRPRQNPRRDPLAMLR